MLSGGESTFGLFLEHIFDVLETALGLTHGIHSMDVVSMKRFIKDEDGNIANAAEVDKIFNRKREPSFKGMSQHYISKKIRNWMSAMAKMTKVMMK